MNKDMSPLIFSLWCKRVLSKALVLMDFLDKASQHQLLLYRSLPQSLR